ncbi:TPA: hypothetical protein H1009_00645, partial [archaeon]|nr:hypothetical protein [Candidatus Naiadarchaeales archaeon SRR2090153.bin461]
IKISNIEMLDSMPIFLENRPEQVKEHLNDLSAQIIFCFYLAKLYDFDLMQNMEQLYRKKLEN